MPLTRSSSTLGEAWPSCAGAALATPFGSGIFELTPQPPRIAPEPVTAERHVCSSPAASGAVLTNVHDLFAPRMMERLPGEGAMTRMTAVALFLAALAPTHSVAACVCRCVD